VKINIALTNQAKVAIVAGICLIGLVAVLKNILQVPTNELTSNLIVYIAIYGAFIALPYADEKASRYDPLVWCAMILAVTLAIVAITVIT